MVEVVTAPGHPSQPLQGRCFSSFIPQWRLQGAAATGFAPWDVGQLAAPLGGGYGSGPCGRVCAAALCQLWGTWTNIASYAPEGPTLQSWEIPVIRWAGQGGPEALMAGAVISTCN